MQFQEGEIIEEAWSIPKIIIGVAVTVGVAAGGYGVKHYYFDKQPAQNITRPSVSTQFVESASTDQNSNQDTSTGQTSSYSLPSVKSIQTDISQKIKTLTQQVSSLNAAEIASSSPQVQKVLNDIKSLEQYPSNQAKDMCEQICSKL